MANLPDWRLTAQKNTRPNGTTHYTILVKVSKRYAASFGPIINVEGTIQTGFRIRGVPEGTTDPRALTVGLDGQGMVTVPAETIENCEERLTIYKRRRENITLEIAQGHIDVKTGLLSVEFSPFDISQLVEPPTHWVLLADDDADGIFQGDEKAIVEFVATLNSDEAVEAAQEKRRAMIYRAMPFKLINLTSKAESNA